MIAVYHIVVPGLYNGALPTPPRKKSKLEPAEQLLLTSDSVCHAVSSFLQTLSGPTVPASFDVSVAPDGTSAVFCFIPCVLTAMKTNPTLEALHLCSSDVEAACSLPRTIPLTIQGEAITAFRHVVRHAPRGPVPTALHDKKVLVVGAGGIGCELLKVAALRGFRDIVVVDLDTIDATNLNRQFLFSKDDVGQSKAVTARKAVLALFDDVAVPPKIVALQANVKDAEFSVDYFRQFSLVMNGLDNTSARKHVNRLCMQADVPLIESGTMGYNGQVQPIRRGLSECYDCQPKSSEQKTFAVCTIHAHPSTMIHCTHFAKEFYGRLFGDAAGADEMAFVDTIPPSSLATYEGAAALFTLLFHDKVEQLAAMRQHWVVKPPQPLPANQLLVTAAGPGGRTDHHSVLPLSTVAGVFVDGVMRCARRGRVPFKKDDTLATVVVAAVANLRAACFHIPCQSISDVVTIAGSIVPAIATTNAIIAASVVAQAGAILSGSAPSFVYVRKAPQVRRKLIAGMSGDYVREKLIVHSNPPSAPNPSCVVCSQANPTLGVRLNVDLHTLGSLVEYVLRKQMAMTAPFVNLGSSVLWEDEEMEGLRDAPLRRWIAGDAPTEFVVGCMNQSVEWSMTIAHSPAYLDAAHFALNGTDSASADEMEALRRFSQAARNGGIPINAVVADSAVSASSDDVQIYHPARSHLHGLGDARVATDDGREEEIVVD
jgi:ubiquitin-like 1-activating enzyme E1 B